MIGMSNYNCECGFATDSVQFIEKHFNSKWDYDLKTKKIVKNGHTVLTKDGFY